MILRLFRSRKSMLRDFRKLSLDGKGLGYNSYCRNGKWYWEINPC